MTKEESKCQMQVVPNGPILVKGTVEIVDQKGSKNMKHEMFALCRCGSSHNKPYCDGSHNYVGFKDEP